MPGNHGGIEGWIAMKDDKIQDLNPILTLARDQG